MCSYKILEPVLKDINTNYIQLKTEEVRHNNEILKFTLERMIEAMKNLDPLFKTIFQEAFYGGSFYDDLKVGKPDEFDLDLLMVFSKIVCQKHNTKNCGCVDVKPSNRPGFFWFTVEDDFYKPLNRFIDNGYMQTHLLLNWLQGLVTKALNQICLEISTIYNAFIDYEPPNHYSQSGPAITLRLYGKFGHMNVDLVPAFKFGDDFWPEQGFKPNPSVKFQDFFIVPKKTSGIHHCERYWRASFPYQERELISQKQRLKPALRLLKKMRNNLDHQISSYALKTIVLLDLDNINWNNTLADTFMELLKKYRESLDNKKIIYFWNKNNNVLDGTINDETLKNHYGEISNKIKKIEREYMKNPFVVAEVILRKGSDDYKSFIREYKGDLIEDGRAASDLYTDDNRDLYMQSTNTYGHGSSDGVSGSQITSGSNSWFETGAILLGVGAIAAMGVLGIFANNNRRNN